MTIPAFIAEEKIDKAVRDAKSRHKIISVFRRLKADFGQKLPAVSVEKSYLEITVKHYKSTITLKIKLEDLL